MTEETKCQWSGDLPAKGDESKCESCHRMVARAAILRCRMSGPRVQGLGDVIAKVTHATGIDRVVKAITGGGCGCDKKQSALNRALPLGRGTGAHAHDPSESAPESQNRTESPE